MLSMLIRSADNTHTRSALGLLLAASIPDTTPAVVPPIDGERNNQAVVERLIGLRPADAIILIAENDSGDIIGGLVSQPDIRDLDQIPEDLRRGWVRRVSLLSHLAVIKKARGQGVARNLLATAEAQLRTVGIKWWYGLAAASAGNSAFFEAAGFDLLPEQLIADGITSARIMGLDRASTRPGRFFLRRLQ